MRTMKNEQGPEKSPGIRNISSPPGVTRDYPGLPTRDSPHNHSRDIAVVRSPGYLRFGAR
jgi:hypothetical protein